MESSIDSHGAKRPQSDLAAYQPVLAEPITMAALADRLSLSIDGKAAFRWIQAHPTRTIVLLGVALRVWVYLFNRDYWMDETSLHRNLSGVGFLDFSQRLRSNQLAPFGFLMVERLLMGIAGNSRYVARFVPLVCGLASLHLFRRFVDGRLSKEVACVALGLFAFSDDLVYYTSELKPYSSDLFLSLAVLLATLRVMDQPEGGQSLGSLALIAFLAPWVSFPSAFIIGGCGIALLVDRAARRRWSQLLGIIALAIAWAIGAGLAFRASNRLMGDAGAMQIFWDFAFLPFPPANRSELTVWGGIVLEGFVNPLNLVCPALPAWLVVLPVLLGVRGGWLIARRSPMLFLTLVLPIALALLASSLRLYPYHGRLMLVLVPALFVLIAEGVATPARGLGRSARVILVLWLLAYPCFSTLYQATAPRERFYNSHGDLHGNRFME